MNTGKRIDFDILKRFNSQGPRYTSYPTAPVFSPDFTGQEFKKEIIDTNDTGVDEPLSLYFHFPFCAKPCYFSGHTIPVTHDRSLLSKQQQYNETEHK